MSAIRYLLAVVGFTAWEAGRVIVAALFRVRYRPGGVYDDAPRQWGRHLLRAVGVRPGIEGLEQLEAGKPYVYVANHASFVDVWLLLAVLPGSVRFVAKKELLGIPIFGWALRAGGQIAIDRRNLKSAFSAYDDAARAVRGGMSAVVFVEGTRSRDGRLQDFKKGPFVLAIHAGVPVVPVYIHGTYAVLPTGRLTPLPGPVRLFVGEPIPTAGLSYEDRDRLSRECREAMLAMRRSVDGVPAGG